MIEPIVDEASYSRALQRIEALWNAEPGSPAEQELDALATLVDAYERRQFPMSSVDPIDAIQARCEQLGWTHNELEALIGTSARVTEILERRRALTLPMIRRIHAAMQIPAEVLIAHAGLRPRPPRRTSGRGIPGKGSNRAA